MEGFWSSAYCVRYLKTFQAMSWRDRLLDLSSVLMPVGLTATLYLNRNGEHLDATWKWATILCWVFYGVSVSSYIHGYIAERRGISPTPPGKDPDLAREKERLITISAVVIVLVSLNAAIYISFPGHHLRASEWDLAIILLAAYFPSLSIYTRKRYWNLKL
jgi:hypothetical protein